MIGKIIRSQVMQLKITQLGYRDLSNKNWKCEIERVYFEEYGEEIPAKIEVYATSETELFKKYYSGYQGIAVYFHSQENNINEVYIISPGAQHAKDWEYSLHAMVTGEDIGQAKGVKKLVSEAKKRFGTGASTLFIGLSHSLGHNNNATAHLLFDTFDSIYSVNGAQTNVYQIYNNSKAFKKAIHRKLSPSNINDIYDADPDRLGVLAKKYYEDKGRDIHQLISEDDPLYAVSGIRGFFTLGHVDIYDTNPDYPGLRNIVDAIPDSTIKDIQEIAIQYSAAIENSDINNGIQVLTGINISLIDKLDSNPIKVYFNHQEEINQMAYAMDKKLPKVLKRIKNISLDSGTIFQHLANSGYINSDQKEMIVHELSKIRDGLEEMQTTISIWSGIHELTDSLSLIQMISDLGAYISLVKLKAPDLKNSINKLHQDKLHDTLTMIMNDHSIQGVLKSVEKDPNPLRA